MSRAVGFGQILVIIVPSAGQLPMFKMALPHMANGHILITMPGNFASLEYLNLMKRNGMMNKNLIFVDTDSIPYACRRLGGDRIFVSGTKIALNAAVCPANATHAVLRQVSPLFRLTLKKNRNVIETGQ